MHLSTDEDEVRAAFVGLAVSTAPWWLVLPVQPLPLDVVQPGRPLGTALSVVVVAWTLALMSIGLREAHSLTTRSAVARVTGSVGGVIAVPLVIVLRSGVLSGTDPMP